MHAAWRPQPPKGMGPAPEAAQLHRRGGSPRLQQGTAGTQPPSLPLKMLLNPLSPCSCDAHACTCGQHVMPMFAVAFRLAPFRQTAACPGSDGQAAGQAG